jgi:hypothetical protein
MAMITTTATKTIGNPDLRAATPVEGNQPNMLV